ncbi:MAG: hypothetical protein ABIQ73_16655 [Acidimicrobiales bacterium]
MTLDGRSWVAIDVAGSPVGYVLVDVVDDCAHVEQVRQWAIATNRLAVTLTTFADVPWNRPLYEHLGFRLLPETEIGAELRNVSETEALHGLGPATRVCMRLDLHN